MILKMLKIIYLTSIITFITAIITKTFIVIIASTTVITFWNYNFHYCYIIAQLCFLWMFIQSTPSPAQKPHVWESCEVRFEVYGIYLVLKKTKKLLWQYLLQDMCGAMGAIFVIHWCCRQSSIFTHIFVHKIFSKYFQRYT